MEKYRNKYCKYCRGEALLNFAEVLNCCSCNKVVHISCLKRQAVPGGIYGDTFFNYTCLECSTTGSEVFIRERMTWFQVIILILFHAQKKNAGTANRGFFHWRIHLVSLIDKKWDILFAKDIKRRKNWMGTISGTISHFSPCFFTSGTPVLGSNGWWKLTFPNLTPTACITIYNELATNKQVSLKTHDDIIHLKKIIREYIPTLDLQEDIKSEQIYLKEKEQKLVEDINVNVENELELLPSKFFDDPRSILEHILKSKKVKRKKKSTPRKLPSPILKRSENKFYSFWKKHQRKSKIKNISLNLPLRTIEEEILHNYMSKKKCKDRSEISLNRKLCVRNLKRKHSMQTFDALVSNNDSLSKIPNRHFTKCFDNVNLPKHEKFVATGVIRRTGFFVSPYTNRLLKPLIRRNKEPKYLWLQLMSELIDKVSQIQKTYIEWKIASLDYVYVQANHIPTINSLCEKYFWPGIELSETLEYPEFTCVALYKKLIVAFGFMVPDVKFNETYISFIFTRPEWRGGGIATFMIYHLIQTCMGKDVTLHVAIDNPAIHLYQKFGFKVEEVVYNFYDTYLRDDSNQSKHAFFLRLER